MPIPSRCGLSLLVAFSLLNPPSPNASQTHETWNFLVPVAVGNCQNFQGLTTLDNPTIGLTAGISQVGEPLRVIDAVSDGPAASAGIKICDSIWAIGCG